MENPGTESDITFLNLSHGGLLLGFALLVLFILVTVICLCQFWDYALGQDGDFRGW